MRIDNDLNLVIPVEIGGVNGWVHTSPISFDLWERFYKVITLVNSELYALKMYQMGPKIAHLTLKECAERLGMWDGVNGVQSGLVNEIRRLTNIVMPGANGWEITPFHSAIQSGKLSKKDIAEIEGITTFFIVASAIHGKLTSEFMPLLQLWDAQGESLSCTAFAASLQQSTGAKTGEATA